LGGCGNTLFNIIIITEAEGYKGSKVFEVTTERYKSVTYSDWLLFFKGIVYELFLVSSCSHFWFILAFVISECGVSMFKCVTNILF
jgi:hypothetical protein